jgi:hypothetical protein
VLKVPKDAGEGRKANKQSYYDSATAEGKRKFEELLGVKTTKIQGQLYI